LHLHRPRSRKRVPTLGKAENGAPRFSAQTTCINAAATTGGDPGARGLRRALSIAPGRTGRLVLASLPFARSALVDVAASADRRPGAIVLWRMPRPSPAARPDVTRL